MSTLFIILGVLFIALVVIIPLIEKFGPRYNDVQLGKIGRWIFPLLAILLVAQALRYFFA